MQLRYTEYKALMVLIFLFFISFGSGMMTSVYRTQQTISAPNNIENIAKKSPRYELTYKGNASWYGNPFHGRLTANGETYDMNQMTAAHKTLPFGSLVKVTNLKNGLSTVVRINDRGPYVEGRNIDLSYAAAQHLDMLGTGVIPVRLDIIKPPHVLTGKTKTPFAQK